VRRLRTDQDKSAQQLADRCSELGMPSLTRSVIADMENGRRLWVSVAELMVLARALNTAPIALLYPAPLADETEMLPGVKVDGPFALQWFCGFIEGHDPAAVVASDEGAEKVYARNLRRVQLARETWDLGGRLAALMRAELSAETPAERSQWVDRIADVERRLQMVRQESANAW
jgi:transcriptional regulator with XRE-family HTH domain